MAVAISVLPSIHEGGGSSPTRQTRRLAAFVTAAQRLRLVLTLGVVNLVLVGVALGFGVAGVQSPGTTPGGPTPERVVADRP